MDWLRSICEREFQSRGNQKCLTQFRNWTKVLAPNEVVGSLMKKIISSYTINGDGGRFNLIR